MERNADFKKQAEAVCSLRKFREESDAVNIEKRIRDLLVNWVVTRIANVADSAAFVFAGNWNLFALRLNDSAY